MKRSTFLTLAAFVASAVGLAAIALPEPFLAGKGVTGDPGAVVWMREVGVLILASGVVAFLVRSHADSPTLRAVLIGNALVQLGLFPIEILAYRAGVITKLGGVVPNSILHLILAGAFLHFARNVDIAAKKPATTT
jgi:hypothetical protein